MTIDRADPTAAAATPGLYRRMARNSAVLATGTVVSSLLMMFSVVIAARSLNGRDFGVLVLLQSAVLLLRGLTGFGTQQPVIKLGSDALASHDKRRLGEVISMGLLVDAIAAILTFAIAGVLIELSRRTSLADKDLGSAWILAVSLLFAGFPTSNGIFRLYDRFGLLSLAQTLFATGLVVGYAALYALGATLQSFVAVWAAYFGLNGILQLSLSLEIVRRDHVPIRISPKPFASADGRTLLHYCWSTWGTSTADAMRTNGDSLIVGGIVSVQAAGIYNVARQLAGVVRKLNGIYTAILFPEITRLSAFGDLDGALKLKSRMTRMGVLAGMIGVAGAALAGGFAINLLFGPRFAAAYIPFVILTAAALAQLISFTPSMYVQVYRSPRLLLLLTSIATIAFAVCGVALTFALSITGTAVAHLLFAIALILLCEFALRGVFDTSRAVRSPPWDKLNPEDT